MDDSNNINAKMLGRFAVPGQEIVYKLFDAFLSKTVLEDRLIDFSKPPVEHNDGSVEFETLNADDGASLPSFSELILGQPVASVFLEYSFIRNFYAKFLFEMRNPTCYYLLTGRRKNFHLQAVL